jgi:glycerate 2-kinase
MLNEPRQLLKAMFDAAIGAASPRFRIPAYLPAPSKGRTIVIGAGKASAAMARAVEEHWPGPLSGLVVTRYGHVPCERIEIVEAAIPFPMTTVTGRPNASWKWSKHSVPTTSFWP